MFYRGKWSTRLTPISNEETGSSVTVIGLGSDRWRFLVHGRRWVTFIGFS